MEKIGEKLVIHHHGSEFRFKGEEYIYSKFADNILVSTPDLLEWAPDGIWLPNPIDTKEYELIETSTQNSKLRILHLQVQEKQKELSMCYKQLID
jgi:hypothetical protein